jgi:hypothetical protein
MWYWYLKRNDELLLDIDHPERKVKDGNWYEEIFQRRLYDAIAAEKLKIVDIVVAPSNTSVHLHVAIKLESKLSELEGLIWQLHLGSDLYRAKADLMRNARRIKPASLLIRSTPFANFWRSYDATCRCKDKHSTEQQVALGSRCCKTWLKYRGLTPWDLFGPPSRKENQK